MDDLILKYAAQFATVVAGAMALAETMPLPIGSTSPEPNKGSRKRYSALLYSFALGVGGYEASLVSLPVESRWQAYIGIAVLSVVVVATSHLIVRAAKAAKG